MDSSTIRQGPHTYSGVFRAVAVTPERKIVTDARDMNAHYDEDGNVKLIAEYQSGFVEVSLRWHDIEQIHKHAQKRRDEEPTP